MKAYSLIFVSIIVSCCIYRYTSIVIKPELKENILKFGYGINYKYEGKLAHSFDRFYIVMKFILPMANDLKFSTLKFDDKCSYLYKQHDNRPEIKQQSKDLKAYCHKIKPHAKFYKKADSIS